MFGAKKQVPVEAHEITIDRLARDDALDLLDGARVTFISQASACFAMDPLELAKAIVGRTGEGRRRLHGLAASGLVRIENHHASSFPRQIVRGAESGDPRTNDADIARLVSLERPAAKEAI